MWQLIYMETWRGGPVNHFQKSPDSEAQFGFIWKSCYKHVKHVHTNEPEGCALHVHVTQMAAVALFLGPLDSLIFPLDSSHRSASSLQRIQPLRSLRSNIDFNEDFFRRHGGGAVTEISSYTPKSGLPFTMGRSYIRTRSLQTLLNAGCPTWLTFANGMCMEMLCIISEHEFLRSVCVNYLTWVGVWLCQFVAMWLIHFTMSSWPAYSISLFTSCMKQANYICLLQ